MKVDRVK